MNRKCLVFYICIVILFNFILSYQVPNSNVSVTIGNPETDKISFWGNIRGNPQNSGLLKNIQRSNKNTRLVKSNASYRWFLGSGSSNGSFAVLDAEDNIYSQGTDKYLYSVNNSGELNWKILNQNCGFVSPVVGPDDRIYVGDYQDYFYCFDPQDGREIWSKNFGYPASGFVNAPVITDDGHIYISSWDGNLYAMTLEGELLWFFNQPYSFQGIPAVDKNGNVYVMTDRLYCLNALTGDVNWSFLPEDDQNGSKWFFESSPVIADDNTVYIIGYNNKPDNTILCLFAVDVNGNEKWRYVLLEKDHIDMGLRTSPAIDADGTILIVLTSIDTLIALNPDGSLRNTKSFNRKLSYEASPSIDLYGNVYISYTNGLACLSGDLSTLLWEFVFPDNLGFLHNESSPAISRDSVYITCVSGDNATGYLFCIPIEP